MRTDCDKMKSWNKIKHTPVHRREIKTTHMDTKLWSKSALTNSDKARNGASTKRKTMLANRQTEREPNRMRSDLHSMKSWDKKHYCASWWQRQREREESADAKTRNTTWARPREPWATGQNNAIRPTRNHQREKWEGVGEVHWRIDNITPSWRTDKPKKKQK